MKRLLVVVAVLGVIGVVAGPALARRGPVHRAFCPERVTNYGQQPRPGVPLAAGTYHAEVGDTFAVGGRFNPMPAGPPRVEGDASVVRHVRAETSPTRERCGRVEAGYRYHIYVAERAGAVVIGATPIRISDRP